MRGVKKDEKAEPKIEEPIKIPDMAVALMAASAMGTIPADPTKERPCALDGAPVNSKVVVVLEDGIKRPILMTPAGEQPLAKNDLAYRLPPGARVFKDGEGRYMAEQLSPAQNRPVLVTHSARQAMDAFVVHFHE